MLPPDGMVRLAPGLVRIPDVSLISWQRLPGRKVPRQAVADMAPDLAVEVIRTGEEISGGLSQFLSDENGTVPFPRAADYFAAGVRQVWYVYSASRQVWVYSAPERSVMLGEQDILDGGELAPGFSLPLRQFFAEPGQGNST